MGDHGNMDDLTAALALIQQQMQTQQQQMLQMQQTIQNQQQAAHEQAAVNAAREERDDLAAKVDQLLKGNQSQVIIMEEATHEKSAGDLAFEAELSGDDKQEKESEQQPADTPAVEGNKEPAVGTSSPGPEQPAEVVRSIPEVVPPCEYIPKFPYPVPAKATRKDREEMKCRKMLEDLTVRLPLMDAIQMMPSMRSFMKGLISVRAEAEQSVVNIDADGTPPPQAQQQTSATYPWPREQEGEPIDLDSPLLLDFNCEGWDKGTAARYNALLRVDMLPTRFCHAETLADLGIDEDVFETLHAIGIAPLCYTTHELYPDLARQVLATATITYEDSNAPSYANCSFSFMADGEYCSLSLHKLNEIYETATEPKGVAEPALRVIAKIISNLLFAKDLTSKVTNGELQTLYAGIEDEIRASGSGIPIQKVKMNPGFNFMTMICERRQCLMHGSNKKDRSGSLLTPLFKHFGIDLKTYSFFDKVGTQLFTKLPHPEINRFSVFDNIRFLPPPELLCTDPRAAAPDADMEDVEDITPEAEPSYDLEELADVTDDQAYRRWMVDSQRKNNSLMRRILHLITGGCIGGGNQRQPPAEQTPRSHRPGKAPIGTGTSTEELQTLYTGIEDEIRASGSGIPIQKVKTNPGFNFMTMICERRQCLMHGSNKKDRSGSLLTPLFKHFGIDIGKYIVYKEVQYLNIEYLMACHIMRDEETYNFFDKAGTQLFTKLPHPEITRFSVFDNIRFLPPPELLCTDPRAAVPDADMEDVEDITPEAEPSYDLGELADVTDDQAYRRWMVDSQRRNNSLMRRILHLITGGCIGGSNQRQPPAEKTPRSHRPGRRLWEQALRPRRFIARATDLTKSCQGTPQSHTQKPLTEWTLHITSILVQHSDASHLTLSREAVKD
ncbi:hypothetical protein DY000_02052160 [Brassica cretica]|uniref:Arabidopsis retrotransposon Orf1 C-terminal domain-containing protein n=1 Tax=Brassica cretica TaxID=69181 RepID=A0ABQ7AFG2_BRACR|nr:hypothetical protein DY000_02052160 [Brassica cretica]